MAAHETDPYDEIISEILSADDISRIRSLWNSEKYPKWYDDVCRRVVKAYHSTPSDRKKEVAIALGFLGWIPYRNSRLSGLYFLGTALHYFPTKKLQSLFDGIVSVWFVDRSHSCLQGTRSKEVLEACGVSNYLHRQWSMAELPEEERRKIRRLSGSEKFDIDSLEDYEIPKLDKVLGRISTRDTDWKKRSFLLWDCLHDALHHHGIGFFYGEYIWHRGRKWRATRFPAQFVRVLRESVWLPGKDGMPKRPQDISIAELPASFRRKADRSIVKLLEFKPVRKARHEKPSQTADGIKIIELGSHRPSTPELRWILNGRSGGRRAKKPFGPKKLAIASTSRTKRRRVEKGPEHSLRRK